MQGFLLLRRSVSNTQVILLTFPLSVLEKPGAVSFQQFSRGKGKCKQTGAEWSDGFCLT